MTMERRQFLQGATAACAAALSGISGAALLGAGQAHAAKPEAYEALRRAAGEGVEVEVVPTLYPTGGEKQLVRILTGREVPSGKLPLDVGVVVQNVATVAAVYRALERGEPLVSRVVTVTGPGVGHPRNLEVAIGTPVAHLLSQCDPRPARARALVMGGPMMGFALHDDAAPVVKTSNCVLVDVPTAPAEPALPCIRCGSCSRACPMSLLPQQMYWYSRAKDFDRAREYNLFDCIECGCCAYVCPSHIPLVQYFRFAKSEIVSLDRDRQRAVDVPVLLDRTPVEEVRGMAIGRQLQTAFSGSLDASEESEASRAA